jgi:hypothetical protein
MSYFPNVRISWDIEDYVKSKYFQPEITATGQDICFSFKSNSNSFYEINAVCDSNIFLSDVLTGQSLNVADFQKPFIFIKNNGICNLYINATEQTGNFFCYRDYQQIGLTKVIRRNIKLEPKEAVTWSIFSNYNGAYYESHFCYPFAFFYNFCNVKDINPSGLYPVFEQFKSGKKSIEFTGLCDCSIYYTGFIESQKDSFYTFKTGNSFSDILYFNKNFDQICNYIVNYYQNQNYCHDYDNENFYTLTCYTGFNDVFYNNENFFYLNSGYSYFENIGILETGFKRINLNSGYISVFSGNNCFQFSTAMTGNCGLYESKYDPINCAIYNIITGITGEISGVQVQSECIDYYISVSGFFERTEYNYFNLCSGYYFDTSTYSVYCGNCNPIDTSGILATDDGLNFYLGDFYFYNSFDRYIYCKDIDIELDNQELNSLYCFYCLNGNIFPTGQNEYTGCLFEAASGYFNLLNFQFNNDLSDPLFCKTGILYTGICCESGFYPYKNFLYQEINEKYLPSGINGSGEFFNDSLKLYRFYCDQFGTEKQCLNIIPDEINEFILDANPKIKSLSFNSSVDSGVCLNLNFFKQPNELMETKCLLLFGVSGSCGCREAFYYKESGCNDFYISKFICAYDCIYSGEYSGCCFTIECSPFIEYEYPLVHECNINQNPIIYSHKACFGNNLSGYNKVGNICINKARIVSDQIQCEFLDLKTGNFDLQVNEDKNICIYFDFDFSYGIFKSYIVRAAAYLSGYPQQSFLGNHDFGRFIYYKDNAECYTTLADSKNPTLFGDYSIYIENTGEVYYKPDLDENWIIGNVFTKNLLYFDILLPRRDILNYDYCFALNEQGRSLHSIDKTAESGCFSINGYEVNSLGDALYNNCFSFFHKDYSGVCFVPDGMGGYNEVICSKDIYCIYDLNLCLNECTLNTSSLENKDEYSCSEEYSLQYLNEQKKISLHGLDFCYTPVESVNFQNRNFEILDECYLYLFQINGKNILQDLYVPNRALNSSKFKVITDTEISNDLIYLNTYLCYECGFNMEFKNQNPNNLVQLKIPKIKGSKDSPSVCIRGEAAINVKKDINFYQNIFENLNNDTDYDLNNLLYFIKSYVSSGIAYCCVNSWIDTFGVNAYCEAVNQLFEYDSKEYNFFMIDLNNEVKNLTGENIISDWNLIKNCCSDCTLDLNYPISYRPNSGQGYNYILPILNHISLCNSVCGNTGYYSGEFSESINFNDIFNYKLTGGLLCSSLSFSPAWNESEQCFESGNLLPYISNINLYGNCFDINICKIQMQSTECRDMELNKNYIFTGIQPIFINSNYVLSTISLPVTCSNLEIYEPSQTGTYLSGIFYYLYDIFDFIQCPIRISSPDLTTIESICWQERECDKTLTKYTNGSEGLIKGNAGEINYLANCFRDSNAFDYLNNPVNEVKINIIGSL